MILYFSATGNSAYAARCVAQQLGDDTVDLLSRLQTRDHTPLFSERPWIVVCPTYAWRLPRLVRNWLELTPLRGSREIYFLLTCGDSIGAAGGYARALCEKKGLRCLGCAEIVMPENYIALFRAPAPDRAAQIVAAAHPAIDRTAKLMAVGAQLAEPAPKLADRVRSGPINLLFYRFVIRPQKFFTTDRCTGCGLCVQLCPTRNIRLTAGRPVWGRSCTHCMACLCRCPAAAVEYGRGTARKARYHCPEPPQA